MTWSDQNWCDLTCPWQFCLVKLRFAANNMYPSGFQLSKLRGYFKCIVYFLRLFTIFYYFLLFPMMFYYFLLFSNISYDFLLFPTLSNPNLTGSSTAQSSELLPELLPSKPNMDFVAFNEGRDGAPTGSSMPRGDSETGGSHGSLAVLSRTIWHPGTILTIFTTGYVKQTIRIYLHPWRLTIWQN